eukprot:4785841-Amphidinium_carterae.1
MAFFPTETAAPVLTDLADVREWVEINEHAFKAFESVVGDVANSQRNLAHLPVQVREGDARALSVVETSQVGLVWRIAKRLALRACGMAWNEIDVEDLLVVPEMGESPPMEAAAGQAHN